MVRALSPTGSPTGDNEERMSGSELRCRWRGGGYWEQQQRRVREDVGNEHDACLKSLSLL